MVSFYTKSSSIKLYIITIGHKKMKQLDVVVIPSAFVWDPYMTLTNVTFDPDPCDL